MYNPQLDTFISVVEAGSFNKAAERLFISPPAVIKQVNLLEENLDLPLFIRTHRGLQLTQAGKSLYQDAKYIIQYCKDSVTRAKNAMEETDHIIRIGTSIMTPAQFLVDLWPKIREICPNVKFQLVPYENTPENAREILGNMGQTIDVVAGVFDETMLNLRRPGADQRANLRRGIHPPSLGPEGTADRAGPLWGKAFADAPGLEPLCGSASGRLVEEPPPNSNCGF